MERMPLEIQTLYAELLETLVAMAAQRTIGSLPGSFITKTVRGHTYYYFQSSEPGGSLRQLYLGKKEPLLEKVAKRFESEQLTLSPDRERIARLCTLLRAGGALATDTGIARVLRALAEGGVFHLGGVLVGTQAFRVLGNLLGVRWKRAALQTHDIDVAGERGLALAVPQLTSDIPRILESLEVGFLPVPRLDPGQTSTSFKVRGKPLRVDLLTPAAGREETQPVAIPRFRAAAQPLPFLDFLIRNPVTGAVIDGGGVLVNVPSPARFAFHKLIISQERDAAFHTKVGKDLLQAAQVLAVLADERPGDLLYAWEEIIHSGRSWERKVMAGLSLMRNGHPVEHEKVIELLKDGRSDDR